MEKRQRSQNPDLLLPEFMEERIARIHDFWGDRASPLSDIDRLTVFTTHRCNLRCQYCNGPHLTLKVGDATRKWVMLRTDLTLERFETLITQARKHWKIKHIHFTGGEPTLNPNLPKFIETAKQENILTSLTTNGTARPELYTKLIALGLTEIRISIDANTSESFDSIVGVKNSFKKVVAAIKKIVTLRESGLDIFLVLNTCVGNMNLHMLEEILNFLIALNPNDIKLLVVAQEREAVLNQHDEQMVARLRDNLRKYPNEQFVLLREKIEKLFDQAAVGLADDNTQCLMKNCFVPMTERTLDGANYYPCSIYLRYYGQPLGSLDEAFDEQQKKIMDFVRHHDCRHDPICSQYCTNCCKVFNVRANQTCIPESKNIITIPNPVSDSEVEATLRLIHLLGETDTPDATPFMIVKPHGQMHRGEIIAWLEARGLKVKKIRRIDRWQDCARFLYSWPATPEKVRFNLEMDCAFQLIERGPADVIYFEEPPTTDMLLKLKLELRRLIPTVRFELHIGDKERNIRLNAIHTPNPEDIIRENAILSNFY